MGKHDGLISICVLFLLFSGAVLMTAQSRETRCFQFTWLGPSYNNESVFMNATCKDATKLASGVPCFEPLVVSYDGTPPNLNYMLEQYPQSVLCRLGVNDVCATFTYYFNGKVENSTKMCTRAVSANNTAITRGCYTQRQGSYMIQSCFCRSVPGGRPCNGASQTTALSGFVLTMTAIVAGFTNIKIIL